MPLNKETKPIFLVWHDIGYSLCVWAPVRWSHFLFWPETHIKGLCARSPTRPEEDERTNVPEKRDHSQQKRTVSRREEKEAVSRREQGREQGSQQFCKNMWTQYGLTNARKWVSIPSESFAQIHVRDSLQIHGDLHKSVTKLSLLALGANPSSCLFAFLFLPSSRLSILCVGKEMWNRPGHRWERLQDDSDGHE